LCTYIFWTTISDFVDIFNKHKVICTSLQT
jgi:hypothetical protein